jgi:aspartyl-tRNA(Asn)/glutamyl-tRNA(Gln) amidotransferase subunit A
MVAILAPYDALLMPTTPIVAPAIDDFATEDAFRRLNGLLLRNTTLINFLDGCAVSVPCHAPGGAPVGLMLAGCAGTDATILAIGRAVDDHLASV